MEDILSIIKNFDPFQDVEPEALEWLIDHCTYKKIAEGEIVFKPGDQIENMVIMLDGEIVLFLPHGEKFREFGIWKTGDVSGVLPFSRLDKGLGFAKALKESHLLQCHKDHFPDLVCQSYQLTQNLVAIMSTRIREFTHRGVQDEKLMALGKLSAGLAHELNNPASAMVRSAQKLHDNIHTTPERFKAVMLMRATDEQTDRINEILFSKIENRPDDDNRTLLEKESARDELVDWLEDHDVDNADEIAESLLDFRFEEEDLDNIREIMGGKHLHGILRWIESTLNKENLICEIKESAHRIAGLIHSMKSYSRMDQDDVPEFTDIHKGIIDTMMIMKHKIKAKRIEVVKELDRDLPHVKVHQGQINQVWTNLIDNAIDAMETEGKLIIKTFRERDNFCVIIQDNGKGIAPGVVNRIFEPFFTTKKIGEGTGMGLDIARRIINNHGGDIGVTSRPGETVFRVCLPM